MSHKHLKDLDLSLFAGDYSFLAASVRMDIESGISDCPECAKRLEYWKQVCREDALADDKIQITRDHRRADFVTSAPSEKSLSFELAAMADFHSEQISQSNPDIKDLLVKRGEQINARFNKVQEQKKKKLVWLSVSCGFGLGAAACLVLIWGGVLLDEQLSVKAVEVYPAATVGDAAEAVEIRFQVNQSAYLCIFLLSDSGKIWFGSFDHAPSTLTSPADQYVRQVDASSRGFVVPRHNPETGERGQYIMVIISPGIRPNVSELQSFVSKNPMRQGKTKNDFDALRDRLTSEYGTQCFVTSLPKQCEEA